MSKDQRTDRELERVIAEWYRSTIPDSGVSVAEFGESPPFYPPYCTDLNAIHEAEKKLDRDQAWKLRDLLFESVVSTQGKDGAIHSTHFIYGATARQRAEALVAVIEKSEVAK